MLNSSCTELTLTFSPTRLFFSPPIVDNHICHIFLGISANPWKFLEIPGISLKFLVISWTLDLLFPWNSVHDSCRRFDMSCAFVLKSLVFVCFCSLTNPTLYHCTSVLLAPHILIE